MRITRRNFFRLTSLTLAAAVVSPAVHLVSANEINDPVIRHVPITLPDLPAAFDGFTIAVLTDFHLYPYTQPELIRQAVTMVNDLKPDLVVYLGDYVWQDLDAIFELAPILAGANGKQGVFSIIGNHDIWLDESVIKQGLLEAGLPVLVNQGIPISQGGKILNLVGLDDGWSGNADLPVAMDGLPQDAPVVLLLHEPDLVEDYAQDKRIVLQLSGHSHGGQVRVNGKPFILPHLGRKYDLGLYRVGETWLYTNPGIGTISVPLRYNCPPEVSEIVLVRG
jgi:hypothetical protein